MQKLKNLPDPWVSFFLELGLGALFAPVSGALKSSSLIENLNQAVAQDMMKYVISAAEKTTTKIGMCLGLVSDMPFSFAVFAFFFETTMQVLASSVPIASLRDNLNAAMKLKFRSSPAKQFLHDMAEENRHSRAVGRNFLMVLSRWDRRALAALCLYLPLN